jgi:hypothetical protein
MSRISAKVILVGRSGMPLSKAAILPLSTVTFASAQPCCCDDWSLGLQDNYAARSTGI